MKTFLIFTTLLSLAFAGDDLMECVGGSPTGDKVAAALETCFGTANREVNRDGDMCYDFNSTIGWIEEVYAKDMCVLQAMDWINTEEMSYNWEVVMADVQNLPQEVSQTLMEGHDEFELCVHDMVGMWASDPCYNGTASLYSEEERDTLAKVGYMVAQYECFRGGLMEACFGDDEDVLEQCVGGSETGVELEAAFEFCFANNHTETEMTRMLSKPMSIKSRNEEEMPCIDYNTTVAYIEAVYADDYCVLDQLGWFATDGTMGWNVTEFLDDISGLPNDTANALLAKEEDFDECVKWLIDMGTQDRCWEGPDSLYSDEEREELGQVGTMIAQYECFRHHFHETCMDLYSNDEYHNDDYYTNDDYWTAAGTGPGTSTGTGNGWTATGTGTGDYTAAGK